MFKIFGNEFHISEWVLTWTLVGFSLINGLSRTLWGLLADCISFKMLFCFINILEAVLAFNYYFLSRYDTFYMINNWGVALCLAGNFALFPQYCGKLFPPKVASQAYGLIFVSFSLTTMMGAVICFFFLKQKEDYLYVYIVGGCMALGAFYLNYTFDEGKKEFVEFRRMLFAKHERQESLATEMIERVSII